MQEYVEPVVGWFTLSLIISGIAQGMNRSGFGWWLAGLIAGPLALFILVVFCERLPYKTGING